MPHDNRDLHERLLDEIVVLAQEERSRLSDQPSSAEAADTMKRVAELEDDEQLLREHWVAQGVVRNGYPQVSKACRNPQPCPHVLGLAEKYGLLGEA